MSVWGQMQKEMQENLWYVECKKPTGEVLIKKTFARTADEAIKNVKLKTPIDWKVEYASTV